MDLDQDTEQISQRGFTYYTPSTLERLDFLYIYVTGDKAHDVYA